MLALCLQASDSEERISQMVKVGLYYFLITSLVIFPMGIVAGSLGIAGGVRYIRDRKRVGMFDASKVRRGLLSAVALNRGFCG